MNSLSASVKVRLPKATAETIHTFSKSGTRFTRVVKTGKHRFEVRNKIERLNGHTIEVLVAELDGYGNVTQWGPYADPPLPKKWDERDVLDADAAGEVRHRHAIHD